ncbi:TraR/DksA family transcriptional regulator [Delftia tsuruhatensis]|uniref:TraR/DksA family transcriptional regulator n=1 Tax=Delftia tsuruhatensis TaxID=180282 RepID=UPI002091336D|nr:TraR/DksA C4-type zinc finger protein [Delftia tsuruhatensis]MCO5340744.1 molecular chaperone DnaK [Delftia tsuruhatensis]MCR4548167.1 molecular chaperone DnaK [Delftia tsuruhatensis]HBO1858575.1 molecular chaperone DnaK [Pseudomonas aeruginosa]
MLLDLERFRQRILDELEKVERSLQNSQQAAATVLLDQSSVGRLSRMDALQQQAIARGLTERLQLSKRKLQAARDRIDSGSYFLCCQCDEEIELSRLEHDPATVFCRACMQERDVLLQNRPRG